MTKYFAETNQEKTIELFNKRIVYRSLLHLKNHDNIIAMDVAEKILYGRIDYNFIPITVKNPKLKKITSISSQATQLKAVDFVVDLFEEMVAQFKKCEQTGQLISGDPYLSNLKAFKAYDSPLESYKNYRDIYFNSIAGMLESKNIRIKSFKHMIGTIMPLLKQTTKSQPITYTGFTKSRNCSVMSTGLAIEIADSDYINDHEKYSQFVSSQNWDFYVNTCDSYGFIVDQNVPWRIVVDLDAAGVIEAASRYTETDSAFVTLSKYYVNSSRYNYDFFKHDLFVLYNILREEFRLVTITKHGTINKKLIVPPQYTYNEFVTQFTEQYFIEIYTKLRIYEEQPDMPEELCNKVVEKQIDSYNSTGNLNDLFEFLESQLNKTFDKTGSLSYYNDGERKRQLEDFSENRLENVTITDINNDDFSGY